ncbi:MAG: hypothetical protein N2506_04850 [Dehalococcoidales bacterium]|nr:hypothetical protein [Dehalococcoidales bacterium]
MGLKSFMGFGRKPKEKGNNDEAVLDDVTAERIAKMENRIYSRAKDLKEKAKQLKELSSKPAPDEDVDIGPHQPIGELEVEKDAENVEEDELELEALPPLPGNDTTPAAEGEIKVVQVSLKDISPPAKAPLKAEEINTKGMQMPSQPKDAKDKQPKPAAGAGSTPGKDKQPKVDLSGVSFSELFSTDEDDENPLASLINSLPDVTTEEIMEDIEEVKRIIEEWHNDNTRQYY